ncbi:hypothetical protein [Aneurinibacillus terranovensis]|uniref:hypothetical protein n=1 Tax=Aneurinibacillus terranovensis TaxID=278991 RepID=UPI00040C00EA|nr:hypothetical protein [Aneurinibacillus terranovensis]
MKRLIKRPFILVFFIVALALVTPVLASNLMNKSSTANLATSTGDTSRVTAQPIASATAAKAVNNGSTSASASNANQTLGGSIDQDRVQAIPLDKTLAQVSAEQKQAAHANQNNSGTGEQSMPSSQLANAYAQPVQQPQNGPNPSQGNTLDAKTVQLLRNEGLNQEQINKINQILAAGFPINELTSALSHQGHGHIATIIQWQQNGVNSQNQGWEGEDRGKKKGQKKHEEKDNGKRDHGEHGDHEWEISND